MVWTGINWFRWQGATGIIAFALGERTSRDVFVHSSYHLNSCSFSTVILQLRLYALYFLDKRVLAFMICTFLACLAASATLISIGLSHVKGQASRFRFLPLNHRNNEFDTSPFKPWPMYSQDYRFAYPPISPRTSIVGGYRFLSLKRFFAASHSTEGSKVILTEEIFSNRGKN